VLWAKPTLKTDNCSIITKVKKLEIFIGVLRCDA
jgi:hypothetical protein